MDIGTGMGMLILPRMVDWVVSFLFGVLVLLALYGFWKWYKGQTLISAFLRYGDGVKMRGAITEAVAKTDLAVGDAVRISDGVADKVVSAATSFSDRAVSLGEKFYDKVETFVEAAHETAERIDDALGTDFISEPNPIEFIGIREKVLSIIDEVTREEAAAGNTDGVKVLNELNEEVRSRGVKRITNTITGDFSVEKVKSGYARLIQAFITKALSSSNGNGAKVLTRIKDEITTL